MMADLTNKNLDFLSNEELINVLRSTLEEIDQVASLGAHKSTTYLAVSAIEGLFGELLKLKKLQSNTVPPDIWPTYKDCDGNKHPKKFENLTLHEKEQILQNMGALHPDFKTIYKTVRKFRNYIHPDAEMDNRTPIKQSVAQLALACLNAFIEQYECVRFVAEHEWQLPYGLAQVPVSNVIHMPQNPGDHVSLLVSELPAKDFRKITFQVSIPPGGIFNFVYNYYSKNQFMAARIEGRESQNGKGLDNGRLRCIKWRVWSVNARYTDVSEPSPKLREHSMQVIFDPPGTLSVIVDGKILAFEGDISWDFDPQGKVGFMTEWGLVSIVDLEVKTW